MNQRLLPFERFAVRVVRHAGIALAVTAIALALGMAGYHFLDGQSWIDAFLNASMILGGMGPVSPLSSNAAKVFAGLYALFAGVVFIAVAGVTIAPFAHRLLHRFHLDDEDDR
ncbi:MAG TPA: hypothetical protein VFP80_15645 [Thermoanaerobaculia bacterium]|nr:hypothetical protein [Thermoanaerobaculia bacterium]